MMIVPNSAAASTMVAGIAAMEIALFPLAAYEHVISQEALCDDHRVGGARRSFELLQPCADSLSMRSQLGEDVLKGIGRHVVDRFSLDAAIIA
jgi:hypothetical protein